MQSVKNGFWSIIFTSLCFLSIYYCNNALINKGNQVIFIAAFGAAAVLDLSIQSKDKTSVKTMFLGSIIGSLIGVFFSQLKLDVVWSSIMAISLCTGLMTLFKTKYPPGGAMVLIPILGGPEIQALGYTYVFHPVLTGITVVFLFSRLQLVFIKNHLENGESRNY